MGNVDWHFTLLERSKDDGIRNWDNGCCKLNEAFCNLWRYDHPILCTDVFCWGYLGYIFPMPFFLYLLAHWLLPIAGCTVSAFFVFLQTILHINIRLRGMIVLILSHYKKYLCCKDV